MEEVAATPEGLMRSRYWTTVWWLKAKWHYLVSDPNYRTPEYDRLIKMAVMKSQAGRSVRRRAA